MERSHEPTREEGATELVPQIEQQQNGNAQVTKNMTPGSLDQNLICRIPEGGVGVVSYRGPHCPHGRGGLQISVNARETWRHAIDDDERDLTWTISPDLI